MGYRVKSPDRVVVELAELARRYRVHHFLALDNILDMKYVKALFARFAESKIDYEFYYEVKANLTHEQIRALYRGGVRSVQPGIESLSSHVLHLMRKGVTMLQNVRTLKWCRYYGLGVAWNLIHGFPGETEDDFTASLKLVDEVGYAGAFSFKYSPRPGTPGADLTDQIDEAIKTDRLQRLQRAIDRQQAAFNQRCVGRTFSVLFERPGRHRGQIVGRSPYLQPVQIEAPPSLIGEIAAVTVIDVASNSLFGALAHAPSQVPVFVGAGA